MTTGRCSTRTAGGTVANNPHSSHVYDVTFPLSDTTCPTATVERHTSSPEMDGVRVYALGKKKENIYG